MNTLVTLIYTFRSLGLKIPPFFEINPFMLQVTSPRMLFFIFDTNKTEQRGMCFLFTKKSYQVYVSLNLNNGLSAD